MTDAAPAFQLATVAWPLISLRNTQLENPLEPGQVFTWVTRYEIAFMHEGESPEVRVFVDFSLDYPEGGPRPIELTLKLYAAFSAVGNRSVSGDEAERFIRTEAAAALWPYIQRQVTELTEQSGGPRITPGLRPPTLIGLSSSANSQVPSS